MIRSYLVERRSWLLLFAGMQLLFLLIAYLDESLPLKPVAYVVFLSSLLFLIFLLLRYNKETTFMRRLQAWENSLDTAGITEASTPFERIVAEALTEQTNRLRLSASRHQVALEQEKDELLSWIHEVKTPLTAMHLMIGRLDDAALKASLTFEWLRIHHLLDQQLHQQRLPSIETDIYIEMIDLEAILYLEIKSLQSWCMQKGIGFDVQLDVSHALSDAKWLAFILRQLLTNAVKYSDREAADIIVRSEMRDQRVVLEVTDFGRGIDPKDLPRIFDKGFTSTVWHQDSAATGMGLYLAQKAAATLHIRIAAATQVGAGTTFTLYFPKQNAFAELSGV